jgi:hypothetical protein
MKDSGLYKTVKFVFLICALAVFVYSTMAFGNLARASDEVSREFNPYRMCSVKVLWLPTQKVLVNTVIETNEFVKEDPYLRIIENPTTGLKLRSVSLYAVQGPLLKTLFPHDAPKMMTVITLDRFKGEIKSVFDPSNNVKKVSSAKKPKQKAVVAIIIREDDKKVYRDQDNYRIISTCRAVVPKVKKYAPRTPREFVVESDEKHQIETELTNDGFDIHRASEGF